MKQMKQDTSLYKTPFQLKDCTVSGLSHLACPLWIFSLGYQNPPQAAVFQDGHGPPESSTRGTIQLLTFWVLVWPVSFASRAPSSASSLLGNTFSPSRHVCGLDWSGNCDRWGESCSSLLWFPSQLYNFMTVTLRNSFQPIFKQNAWSRTRMLFFNDTNVNWTVQAASCCWASSLCLFLSASSVNVFTKCRF